MKIILMVMLAAMTTANNIPYAELVMPENGSNGIPVNATLAVRVYDTDGDSINATFYDALHNVIIGSFENVSSGSTLMFIWRNLSYSTTYNWYVEMNDGHVVNRSNIWSFTTMEKPPSCSLVAMPSSGYSPLNVTFKMNASNDSLAWQLDVDGDRIPEYYGKGSPPSILYHTYNSPGTYLARLTVRNSNGRAGYSTSTITVFSPPPNHPPSRPSSPYPCNGSVNVPLHVNLSWNCTDADNDTISYDIYFGNSFPLQKLGENITENHFSVNNLKFSTVYYWQVVARDEHGASSRSQIWQFRTRFPEVYKIDLHVVPSYAGNITPWINKTYEGEIVNLRAVANKNYKFAYWSGDVNGSEANISFIANGNKTIFAHFKKIRPWVVFTEPQNGSTVNGFVEITGKSGEKVEKVDIRVDGERWFQAYGKKLWKAHIDTTHLSNGFHVIEARAYDGFIYGNISKLYINVFNNHRPWVKIAHPSNLEIVSGKIDVKGFAGDDDGDKVIVEVKVNGEWKKANGGEMWEAHIDTTHLSNGFHVIEARAYDGREYGKIARIMIQVENSQNVPGYEIMSLVFAMLIVLMKRMK